MALYQPSNITPSSFAGLGGGVVDVNDDVFISWQVNGPSGMIQVAFEIRENDAAGTLVASWIRPLSTPFYGTDAEGNIRLFEYRPIPSETWADIGLVNGKSYRMTIYQSWSESEGGTAVTKRVAQTAPSVFITRSAPTLSISPASSTLSSVQQSFAASYRQEQNDAVSNVRWVLADEDGNVLKDTGTIYTGDLSFSYNGFFSGKTYALSCTVETQNGVSVTAENTYPVSYTTSSAQGGISLSCNPDDSVTLSWAAGVDIPGVPSAADYGSISDGVLHLAANRSISWSEVNGEAMNFPAPYAFAWRGSLGTYSSRQVSVGSGTWEEYEDSTATGSSNYTLTFNSLALTKPYTGSKTVTLNIPTDPGYQLIEETAHISATAYGSGPQYDVVYNFRSDYVIDSLPTQTDMIVQSGVYVDSVNYIDSTHKVIQFSLRSDSPTMSLYFTYFARKYMGDDYYTPSESGASAPALVSTTATEATVEMDGNRIKITMYAPAYGTYAVEFSYSYQYTGNDSYSQTITSELPSSTGTLTGVSVISTTGTGGATAKILNNSNRYSVTVYNSSAASCTVTVRRTYSYETTSDRSYRSIVTGTTAGAVSGAIVSTTAAGGAEVTVNNGNYTVTFYHSSASAVTASVDFQIFSVVSHSNLLTLTPVGIVLSNTTTLVVLTVPGSTTHYFPIPAGAVECLAAFSPDRSLAVFFGADGTIRARYGPYPESDVFSDITGVTIGGAQDCNYVYITADTDYDFIAHAEGPGWGGATYFNASFAENLQAGTLASSDSLAAAIYRMEGTALTPLGEYASDITEIRDYGIRSRASYEYVLYYLADETYSVGMVSGGICRQFRQYTLVEAEEDPDEAGVYHPVSVWRFRNNIEAGAVSNGNTPALLDNFTKYPHWQPSSPAAKSGTLTALLSFFSEGEYLAETAEDMEALYALSHSLNPLFLRDMKGNLYMVRLSGPVTQTINHASGKMEVTVSVPWIEVGDASDARIIQVGG